MLAKLKDGPICPKNIGRSTGQTGKKPSVGA